MPGPGAVPLWFARLLRDGFALTAMGGYATSADLAADALRGLDPERVGDRVVAGVLALAVPDHHHDQNIVGYPEFDRWDRFALPTPQD
jgi:2-haloacid dehalogenase